MFAISTEEIQALFDKELAKANEHNSQFHSSHEAYAVLLEEVEEAKEALSNLDYYTERIWSIVKKDDYLTVSIKGAKMFASSLIREAIQVGAMCDKFLNYLDTKKEGKQNV
nr:MAG TPA: Dolichol-phosphate mannosyltransferase subunit [Caudoviricetes sp.]